MRTLRTQPRSTAAVRAQPLTDPEVAAPSEPASSRLASAIEQMRLGGGGTEQGADMPLFTSKRPQGIAQSIKSLLTSSGQPNAMDMIKAETAASTINHNSALTQKAVAEVEAMRQADQFRRDPNNAVRLGAWSSGMSEPDAQQYYKSRTGAVAPQLVANDDEGNTLPPAPYQPHENLDPGKARQFDAVLASTMANMLATGKSNAEQVTKAGTDILADRMRTLIAAETDPAKQNQYKASIPGSGYREPFSGGVSAQGLTVNQETGAPVVASQPLLDSSISQREAQAQAAEARAALAEARAAAAGSGGSSRAAEIALEKKGWRWNEDHTALEPIPGGPASGKALGKALPTSAAQKMMENQQNLRRAEQALSLISGQGADADPAATGWKGYAPDALLQRLDPKGVQTRAAIGDLGSLVIHDRSGAAVTASEFPRLRPFIPQTTDDPATVKKKLERFTQVYRDVVGEAVDFYKESGYNVPEHTLRGGSAAGASGASGSWNGEDRRQQPRGAPAKRVVVNW